MKIKLIIFAFFAFYSVPAFAGINICSDFSGNVTKFTLRGDKIQGCAWFDAGQNVTDEQAEQIRTLLRTKVMKYLKMQDGMLVEKSAAEKTAADEAEAEMLQNMERAEADKFLVENEEIIKALIQVINLRLPAGQKITKQEIIDQIKANKGL